ncbi:unnamed protein product, partial [Heterosigma akashiwo]
VRLLRAVAVPANNTNSAESILIYQPTVMEIPPHRPRQDQTILLLLLKQGTLKKVLWFGKCF